MLTISIPGAQRPSAATNKISRKLSTYIRTLRWRIARSIIEADSAPNPLQWKGGAR